MDDNERELVLRISVDADDIAPEVARLKAELAALDKAAASGANSSAAAQDKATAATNKRKKATEDLGKTVATQSAAERKQLEDGIKALEKHQQSLNEYQKQVSEYQRRVAEVEAANAVAQQRFRTGQARKLETAPTPEPPARPEPPRGLAFQAGVAQVDHGAAVREAKAIVDAEDAQQKAVVEEVKKQRGSRRRPAALPAPKPVPASESLQSGDRDALLQQLGIGQPSDRARTEADKIKVQVETSEQKVVDAARKAADKKIAANERAATQIAANVVPPLIDPSDEPSQRDAYREQQQRSEVRKLTAPAAKVFNPYQEAPGNALAAKVPMAERVRRAYDQLAPQQGAPVELEKLYENVAGGKNNVGGIVRDLNGMLRQLNDLREDVNLSFTPGAKSPGKTPFKVKGTEVNTISMGDVGGNSLLNENDRPVLPQRREFTPGTESAKKQAEQFASYARLRLRQLYYNLTEDQAISVKTLREKMAEVTDEEFSAALAKIQQFDTSDVVQAKGVPQTIQFGPKATLARNRRVDQAGIRAIEEANKADAAARKAAVEQRATEERQQLLDRESGQAGTAEPHYREVSSGRLIGSNDAKNIDFRGIGRTLADSSPDQLVRDYLSPNGIEANAANKKLSLPDQIRRLYDRTTTQPGEPLKIFDAANASLRDLPGKANIRNELAEMAKRGEIELLRSESPTIAGSDLQLPDLTGHADRFTIPGLGGNSLLSPEQRAAIEIAKRGTPVSQSTVAQQVVAQPQTTRPAQPVTASVLEQQRAFADRFQAAIEAANTADEEELKEYAAERRAARRDAIKNKQLEVEVEPPSGFLGQLALGQEMADDIQGVESVKERKAQAKRAVTERQRQIAEYEARRAIAAPATPPAPLPVEPLAAEQVETDEDRYPGNADDVRLSAAGRAKLAYDRLAPGVGEPVSIAQLREELQRLPGFEGGKRPVTEALRQARKFGGANLFAPSSATREELAAGFTDGGTRVSHLSIGDYGANSLIHPDQRSGVAPEPAGDNRSLEQKIREYFELQRHVRTQGGNQPASPFAREDLSNYSDGSLRASMGVPQKELEAALVKLITTPDNGFSGALTPGYKNDPDKARKRSSRLKIGRREISDVQYRFPEQDPEPSARLLQAKREEDEYRAEQRQEIAAQQASEAARREKLRADEETRRQEMLRRVADREVEERKAVAEPPTVPTPEPSSLGQETITLEEFQRQQAAQTPAPQPSIAANRPPEIPGESAENRKIRLHRERDDRYKARRQELREAARQAAGGGAKPPTPPKPPAPPAAAPDPEPEPEPTPAISEPPAEVQPAVRKVRKRAKKAVEAANEQVDKLQEQLNDAVVEGTRDAQAKPERTFEPPAPPRRIFGDDTPINFDAPDDFSGPPPVNFDLLDDEPEPREQRAIGGPPRRLAIGPAPKRAIAIGPGTSGNGPFVQDPRRKQSRDRQNLIRKDQRTQARLERERQAAEVAARQAAGKKLLGIVDEFGPDDDPYAFTEPDYRGRIGERNPGEPIAEFMDRLDEEAGRYLPKPPRDRPKRAKAIEPERTQRLAIEAPGAADPNRLPVPLEFPYDGGVPYDPETSQPGAVEPDAPAKKSRSRRSSTDKVKAEVDCEHLDHSIKDCLKTKRYKIKVEADGVGTPSGTPGSGTPTPGTGDPVADAKLSRATKAAEDAEAAKIRKEAAGIDRETSGINKDTARENRASAKANADSARDVRDITRDTKLFAKEAAKFDNVDAIKQAAQLRRDVGDFERQSAAERLAQARANAATARQQNVTAQVRTAEAKRRAEAAAKRDEASAARRGRSTEPKGFVNAFKVLFSDLGRGAGRLVGETIRPRGTTGPEGVTTPSRTISGPSRLLRSVIAGTDNRLLPDTFKDALKGLITPLQAGFRRARFAPERTADGARQFAVNSVGKAEQLDEGIFKRIRAGFKTAFDSTVVGGIAKEFRRLGKDSESIFASMGRGFRNAFKSAGGDGGAGPLKGFLTSAATSVSRFSDNILKSFSGMNLRLFSFSTVIIAVLAALGPLVAILGSLGAGALGAANGLFQLVSSVAALPGLLSAAATGVVALIVAFKPLTNILSAYSAKQDAVTAATAAGTSVAKTATRAQQDLNRARRDAKRDIEDMATSLSRIKLTENGAVLSVKQARQSYLETLADPGSTLLDQQVAYQAYQEAKNARDDLKTKDKRLAEDYNTDGTVKNPAKYGDDNQRKVDDATTTAKTGGTSAAATASAKLDTELAKAGPNTRKFAIGLAKIFLDPDSPWKKTQKAVAEAVFKPLVGQLGNISGLLGPLTTLLTSAGGAIGNVAKKGIELLSSGPFTKFFADQSKANAGLITKLGDAGLYVVDAFMQIIEAARPFTDYIAGAIKGLAQDFDDWATKGNKSGGIASFLKNQVTPTLKNIGGIVGNLFKAFANLFTGSNDFTQDFFGTLKKVTDKFFEWSKEAANPNSGFRKFLRDTMPLLKQLGGFIVDVVKSFFKIAADPRNINEAKRILTILSEKVLPAIVKFFTELSDSGLVSKFLDAIGDIADAFNKFIEAGGGTAFTTFLTGLQTIVKYFKALFDLPGVATIFGVAAIGLASLAAAAAFFKFTGLSSLFTFLKFLVNNRSNLANIISKVAGFFGLKVFGGAAKTAASAATSAAGEAAGEATGDASEKGILGRISGQITAVIGWLEKITACVCRETPCTCKETGGTSTSPAGTLTAAGEQLIVAARELMVAAATLRLGGATNALTRGLTPTAIAATAAAEGGTAAIAGRASTARAIESGTTARVIDGTATETTGTAARAEQAAAKSGIFGKLARGSSKVLAPIALATLAYSLIKPLFNKDSDTVDPVTGKKQSYVEQAGGPATLGFSALAAGTLAPSLLRKLPKSVTSILTGANKADPASRGTFNVSDVDENGYARQTTKKPSFVNKLLRNILTPGTEETGEKVAATGLKRFLPTALRTAATGGRLTGLADPLTTVGALTGIAADLLFPGAKRKTAPAQGLRATGAVLTGAGIGASIGSIVPGVGTAIGAGVGAAVGGIYSLVKDPGLRKTVGSAAGKVGDVVSSAASAVGNFFTGDGGLGKFFAKVGDGFHKYLITPVADFFTKTLPALPGIILNGIKALPGKILDGFAYTIGFLHGFFTDALPRLIGQGLSKAGKFFDKYLVKPVKDFVFGIPGFFTETIPKWFSSARRWVREEISNPIKNFILGIPGFFTETIPKWFSSAKAFIRNDVIDPMVTFVTQTLPNFFTQTIPEWFAKVPGFIRANILEPLGNFFSKTLPNFFLVDLPNAIGKIPGYIYDRIIQPVIDFFSEIPAAIGRFFTGSFDAITELAKKIKDRFGKKYDEGDKTGSSVGKQSGGLIEGTYDGRVDTKIVPLTIGEFVARKRVVDKPLGKELFSALNEERLDPADFYAALNNSTKMASISVAMPAMRLSEPSTTSTTVNNTVNNSRGGHTFGDVIIHNPVREKSERSMRRTLHKLAYMTER